MNNIELYKDVIDVVASNRDLCPVAIEVAKTSPKAFLEAAARLGMGSKTSRMEVIKKEVQRLIVAEGRIPAIKYVRSKLGWGLKEAKEFCEQYWN